MISSSPRVVRGAIVGLDSANVISSLIALQYNPATMTRRIEPQSIGDEGAVYETQRLKGPPKETISFEAEIDATDQLATGDGTAKLLGISPQLSALEMLVYPKIALVTNNIILVEKGVIEISPPAGSYTCFVWGAERVLPVRLTECTITEEAYDINLNPIRATVNLSMEVVSYSSSTIANPTF